MKFDSCLSFQTAELTDDLPVWLASVQNSSFQLHSASGIQWWESYRNWTGRAVSRVSVELTDAQNCNLCQLISFFFRKWTHPDLKEHTESNTIKVELNKQWKRNNYAAIIMHLLLKALREYCIGCQKGHDLSRTLGTKFYSPFLWLQRPHTSLHNLEMELLCNIQKYQRETFEIPVPTCLAVPSGGKKKYLGDRESKWNQH